MTTHPNQKLLDEIAAELVHLDEQGMAQMFALMAAMKHAPERAELRALVFGDDPSAIGDWLRAHGWLDVDPVTKLGVLGRLALQEQQSEMAAERRLDVLVPGHDRPEQNVN